MNMANPLTGAPGAVLLYGLIGLIVWPDRAPRRAAGRPRRPHRVGRALARDGLALAEAPEQRRECDLGAIKAAPSGMSWLSKPAEMGRRRRAGQWPAIALLLARSPPRSAISWRSTGTRGFISVDRAEPSLLGPRPGLRRHRPGWRHRSQCRDLPLFVVLALALVLAHDPVSRAGQSPSGRTVPARATRGSAGPTGLHPTRSAPAPRSRRAALPGCAAADKKEASVQLERIDER